MTTCDFTLLDEVSCAHCSGAQLPGEERSRGQNVDVSGAGERWPKAEATDLGETYARWESVYSITEFANEFSEDLGNGRFGRSARSIVTQLTKNTTAYRVWQEKRGGAL